ncbi:MAG: rhodanese-like domain-containing protein [Pseudorhodobacter sp.]|nr:rhodanese-like domain-containing protein [Pseudorhodobacter sp.]
MNKMVNWLSAPAAKEALHAGGEIAFLDVREAGQFADGHPLFATPCPYSRLELTVGALVPRLDVPVLLIDGGDGIAERSAVALRRMGYSDVSAIREGVRGWAAAGFTLFKGVNVPSKTLGELAEHRFQPRRIGAETLIAWRDAGREVQLFDCRPPEECQKMRIPGSVCLPNGELAHRFDAAVTGSGPVVLTCAGRTRSLIGTVGLTLAGISGEVFALENGTQGWALAGQRLERGAAPQPFPDLTGAARVATKARALALLEREGIPVIAAQTAIEMRAEAGRTTYLFDLRAPEDIKAHPLAAFTPALSGQLVQATDQWVGVRQARLILGDDPGLRAAIAAYWLRALGYEVFVLPLDASARQIPALPIPARLPDQPVTEVDPALALRETQDGRGQLVDLRPSAAFRQGHVAGAIWAVRPRLPALCKGVDAPVFLIAQTEAKAALAAGDLRAAGHNRIFAVKGGYPALIAAGAASVASSEPANSDELIDFVWFAHGRHDGDLTASRLYLHWEQGLIAQLDTAERAAFGL